MSTIWLQPPLAARNGHTLQVLEVCRVSDPTKQDERSPDEQGASLDEWLASRTDLPFEVTPLKGSGSGELLDRHEYLQLLDLVATDRYDLVLTEDLGRIVRRIHAHLVCEHCVDHQTRLISPFVDQVDTAVEGWQDRSIFSAWHHERSNRDTSQRIRRAHRARFLQGGCIPRLIYGYRFRPGTSTISGKRTDADLEKNPGAEEIYRTWFQMLDNDALYAEVSDWLNQMNVALGPYVRKKRCWDGSLVGEVTHNVLLKGIRIHNKRRSRRINNTGKYRSEKAAPEDLLIREVPHLAFFEPAYYDRVVAKADARNAKFRRNADGGLDPRRNVPKKRARFPGQIIDCGICGRQYVFGGHGQTDHLMCNGAREYACWNGATVDGVLATNAISKAVFAAIDTLGAIDTAFAARVQEKALRLDEARVTQLQDFGAKLSKVDRQIGNLVAFVRDGDQSPSIRSELQALERERNQLRYELGKTERNPVSKIVIPEIAELKQLAQESFRDLARDSYEFANVMRQLIGRITVLPYQLCDGGPIVLRARFQLRLANLLTDDRLKEVFQEPLARNVCVDLFAQPQRAACRERILELRRTMSERQAAKELGITTTAAQRAATLDRRMKSLGLSDPYIPVLEPSADFGKVRRFLHPRYRFGPLPSYPIQHW